MSVHGSSRGSVCVISAVNFAAEHTFSIVVFAIDYSFVCVSEDEREQVERLRWPSRGYLQELSEYQQRRRKIRKSRCVVMWLATWRPNTSGTQGRRTETVIMRSLGETVGWRADSEDQCFKGGKKKKDSLTIRSDDSHPPQGNFLHLMTGT